MGGLSTWDSAARRVMDGWVDIAVILDVIYQVPEYRISTKWASAI